MGKKIYGFLALLAIVSLAYMGHGQKASAENGASAFPTNGMVSGSGYSPDKQTATAFRAGLTSADTLSQAGILATTEFLLKGKQNIPVGAWFSASGKTCDVQIAYVHKDPLEGSSTSTTVNTIKGFSPVITLSGGTALKNAVYPAPDTVFDGEGANAIRVLLITAPTGGATVDLRVGSY